MQGASFGASLMWWFGMGRLARWLLFCCTCVQFSREIERWKVVLLVGVKKFTKNRFFLLKSFFGSCIVLLVIDVRCDSGP